MPRKSKKASQTALKGRFKIVTHKGRQIAIADYSHATRSETWALTDFVDAWLGEQEADSVNLYFEMQDVYYEAAHVNHWKKTLGQRDPFIRKSCFVHASPLMLVIAKAMRIYSTFIGTPMKANRGVFFEDKDAAMDFLSEP